MYGQTTQYLPDEVRDGEIYRVMFEVYAALREKGYNPINQIVGYLLSQDPTYITTHNNARTLITKLDRDDIMNALVYYFVNDNDNP